MVNPDDIVVDGWDISSMNLADAMTRARVLDVNLQQQLRPFMKDMKPLPSIYFPDFIAANQVSSAIRMYWVKYNIKSHICLLIKPDFMPQ